MQTSDFTYLASWREQRRFLFSYRSCQVRFLVGTPNVYFRGFAYPYLI